MTLEEIAAKHPTDKLGTHSYLPIYERLFAPLRDAMYPVLEIGVDGGGSLCIWKEWFTQASIIGADINVKPPYIEGVDRVSHWQGDAYTADAAINFAKYAMYYSVIIDDGPHSIESQRWFCANYPQLLSKGGIAIVEDIQRIEDAPSLHLALPTGFNSAIIDLRHVKGRYDDILFLAWRK